MERIYFYSNKEVISFCEKLFHRKQNINIQWKTDKHLGNGIYFIEQNLPEDTVIHCLIHVFLTYRLNRAIETVIMNDYYFSNREEISRIVEITNWLIFDLEKERQTEEKMKNIELFLFQLFKSNLSNKQIVHFDSVINFQMQSFKNYLIDVVGLAIDEFKREEEHQDFIHSVREYIGKRKVKQDEIHIVQGNPFLFYNNNGNKYTTKQLKKIMYNEPLYVVGLDDTEMNLAPLIALLPNKISIYGDDPSEAMTMAIINVFQEKVCFLPYEKFPFKHQKDKS